MSNIQLNGKNYLKSVGYNESCLFLSHGASTETYYIGSTGRANLSELTVSILTTDSLTVKNPTTIQLTGKNYLKSVDYNESCLFLSHGASTETYYIGSTGRANLSELTVSILTTDSLTVKNPTTIQLTGKNYLKSVDYNESCLFLSHGASTEYFYIGSTGNASLNDIQYTSLQQASSRRFKENINYKDNTCWHDKLMNIKPCTFNYLDTNEERIGVIAEDLYETFPELVQKDNNGLISSVSYVDMIIPLVSEVQRLNNVITKQQNEIDELKSLIS